MASQWSCCFAFHQNTFMSMDTNTPAPQNLPESLPMWTSKSTTQTLPVITPLPLEWDFNEHLEGLWALACQDQVKPSAWDSVVGVTPMTHEIKHAYLILFELLHWFQLRSNDRNNMQLVCFNPCFNHHGYKRWKLESVSALILETWDKRLQYWKKMKFHSCAHKFTHSLQNSGKKINR